MGIASKRGFGTEVAAGRIEGDVDDGVLPAGQAAALIDAVEDAGALVRRIVAEAEAAWARLSC